MFVINVKRGIYPLVKNAYRDVNKGIGTNKNKYVNNVVLKIVNNAILI